MPSPVTSTLLIFGAVLTALSPAAGVVIAGLGLLFELTLFAYNGRQ